MYQGFIKSTPEELEEAAIIDGAGQFKNLYVYYLSAGKAMYDHGGHFLSAFPCGTISSRRC